MAMRREGKKWFSSPPPGLTYGAFPLALLDSTRLRYQGVIFHYETAVTFFYHTNNGDDGALAARSVAF